MSASLNAALNLYREGGLMKLDLLPYRAAEPHGLTQYPENPPPPNLPPGWLRGFNPYRECRNEQATILIEDWTSAGDGRRAQILLCSIVKTPARDTSASAGEHCALPSKGCVSAKIFDPEFYPGDDGAPYSNSEQADGNLSREAGALSHLFKKGLTGYPHLAPQYYGTWATRFKVGEDDAGRPKYRCVGLVLTEFIDGFSLDEICTRNADGYLVAPPGKLDFGIRGARKWQGFDKEFRQEIIGYALDGIVKHLHVGVEHHDFDPRNVFVTLINGEENADRARAVLLDYTLSQVWIKTKQGRESGYGEHILELLPHPPHPAERFSVTAMQFFVGWFPSPDREWSAEDQDYTGPEFDNETEFKDWLIEAFGPLHEDRRYSSFEAIPKLKKQQVLGRFLGRLEGGVIASKLRPISSDDLTKQYGVNLAKCITEFLDSSRDVFSKATELEKIFIELGFPIVEHPRSPQFKMPGMVPDLDALAESSSLMDIGTFLSGRLRGRNQQQRTEEVDERSIAESMFPAPRFQHAASSLSPEYQLYMRNAMPPGSYFRSWDEASSRSPDTGLWSLMMENLGATSDISITNRDHSGQQTTTGTFGRSQMPVPQWGESMRSQMSMPVPQGDENVPPSPRTNADQQGRSGGEKSDDYEEAQPPWM
ncbi:hypothetical protein Cob_v005120 [Colletotrichum orbiculare MAFF 240422]|uniref:Protein kinase domain-containing protein n=1 Tax=Colletotrichum orbiculare (strain 104-T / ATCC 96160 / CBS 514.97 / LARS 414 / MAFF 240422) TaxID=1213857 RepID=N4V7X0_COLOR|nr:hypothetical protein Cob_v005120 [Colletotrichum orbiculare MAFF 240422]